MRSLSYFPSTSVERLQSLGPQASEYIMARVYNKFSDGHLDIIRREICSEFLGALSEDKVCIYVFYYKIVEELFLICPKKFRYRKCTRNNFDIYAAFKYLVSKNTILKSEFLKSNVKYSKLSLFS